MIATPGSHASQCHQPQTQETTFPASQFAEIKGDPQTLRHPLPKGSFLAKTLLLRLQHYIYNNRLSYLLYK